MPRFAQRHYEAIADVMAKMRPTFYADFNLEPDCQMWQAIVDDLIALFERDNPNFKTHVFRKRTTNG